MWALWTSPSWPSVESLPPSKLCLPTSDRWQIPRSDADALVILLSVSNHLWSILWLYATVFVNLWTNLILSCEVIVQHSHDSYINDEFFCVNFAYSWKSLYNEETKSSLIKSSVLMTCFYLNCFASCTIRSLFCGSWVILLRLYKNYLAVGLLKFRFKW
jgi:hypothetical protein